MFKKEVWIALAVFAAITSGMIWLFDYRMPYLVAISVYLLIYWITTQIVAHFEPKQADEQIEHEWPTSGPIGKYGQRGLITTFTLSSLLAFLNPFQLAQIILQGIGNLVLTMQYGNKSQDLANYINKVAYTLPYDGEWFVYNGGLTPAMSHSWDVLTQRYAYDFVMVDEQLQRHQDRGTALTDYHCYGKPILAAADGTIVKVQDGIHDAPFVGYGIVDFLARSFTGNHVIIQHADREYGFYAHLIKGSIPVAVGDTVQRGQPIGRCGHSGHSSEPHLHFHLQNRANFYFAMGLPIKFVNVAIDQVDQDCAMIEAGDHVHNQAKADSVDRVSLSG